MLRFGQKENQFSFIQTRITFRTDQIHDVFHVSMLRRYLFDLSHIVLIEEIEVLPNLLFEEEPIQILNREVKVLRKKWIALVKVLW
ncbi:reverse transcriptase [Gossypium australe]|uniref:Reverse transcriptase n=1 Tax=Gossypium australe TaxID=47621 RepID=A0A5B6UVQ0_9ROSI|nr:reverse transcriptase [Gossypium australe]